MMEVRPERTGWRDERLSQRHRTVWGYDCPMTDIDYLTIEYDYHRPSILIEYKYSFDASTPYPMARCRSATTALSNLADSAKIPFLGVVYNDSPWAFHVVPLNARAMERIDGDPVLDEYEYVSLLYELRGRKMPKEIAAKIAVAA